MLEGILKGVIGLGIGLAMCFAAMMIGDKMMRIPLYARFVKRVAGDLTGGGSVVALAILWFTLPILVYIKRLF